MIQDKSLKDIEFNWGYLFTAFTSIAEFLAKQD